MSVRATPEGTGSPAAYESYGDEERGYGWVAFAGVLLLILGTINYRFDETGVPLLGWGGEPWLQHLAVLFGWWHAALWVFSLAHFRRQGTGRSAGPLLPWNHVAVLATLGVAAILLSRSLTLRERCMTLGFTCPLKQASIIGCQSFARDES